MGIENEITIYVDGSYENKIKTYGSGVVVVKDGKVIFTYNEKGDNKEFTQHRNVTGEIFGAIRGMQWALSNGYKNITLCYDYEGIEKWAKRIWKANKKLTQKYQQEVSKYEQIGLNITFQKVKAHSGNEFNDLADKLAKEAIYK